MLDPACRLCAEDEKKRYETHNNDPEDEGYRQFVAPIVNAIKKGFAPHHLGLDFGAGTGPVITHVLQQSGYHVNLYDPFFWRHPEHLKLTYDYIACCEVIEHFHNPEKEFGLLRSLLTPNGALYCMTALYNDEIDFENWYYKNDPTHVFFYHRKTVEWIKKQFSFSEAVIHDRLIQLLT